MANYKYWQDALQGKFGSVHDGHPQPGFYRRKSKQGESSPVAIWEQDGKMLALDGKKQVDANEIWTWVCMAAVTESAYRAVIAGQPWPESIAQPGSNNPPADEATGDEVESAINAAMAALKTPIKTQADCDKLGNFRDRLSGLYKAQEAKRVVDKQPHLDAGKRVDEAYTPILAKIEVAGKALKDAITTFLLAERDRQLKEQARLAEIDRQAREKAAAANAPAPEPMAAPEPVKVKAGTTGRATALRAFKSATIENYQEALKALADNAEIKALVQTLADRAARADIALPGCKIKIEERAS